MQGGVSHHPFAWESLLMVAFAGRWVTTRSRGPSRTQMVSSMGWCRSAGWAWTATASSPLLATLLLASSNSNSSTWWTTPSPPSRAMPSSPWRTLKSCKCQSLSSWSPWVLVTLELYQNTYPLQSLQFILSTVRLPALLAGCMAEGDWFRPEHQSRVRPPWEPPRLECLRCPAWCLQVQ